MPSARTAADHWTASRRVLLKLQVVLAVVGLVAIGAYCGIVGHWLGDMRALRFVAPFLWPAVTVGILALFQRLMLGGPNKRIPPTLIRELRWRDFASFPYRLREALLRVVGRSLDPDPMRASPGYLLRLMVNVVSFGPTLGLMPIPIVGTCWLTGRWPTLGELWSNAWGLEGPRARRLHGLRRLLCGVRAGADLAERDQSLVADRAGCHGHGSRTKGSPASGSAGLRSLAFSSPLCSYNVRFTVPPTKVLVWISACVALGFGVRPANAQVNAAIIEIVVSAADRKPLPSVRVTATNLETGFVIEAVTSESGTAKLTALQPGLYDVRFERDGWQPLIQKALTLLVGQVVVLEATMHARLAETVTVTGNAPQVVDVAKDRFLDQRRARAD